MWIIEYSKEVRDYIFDSYPYTAQVWQAIKSLLSTTDGLPSSDYLMIERETYLWKVADHLVIYQRSLTQRKLIFTVLKPVGNDGFDF